MSVERDEKTGINREERQELGGSHKGNVPTITCALYIHQTTPRTCDRRWITTARGCGVSYRTINASDAVSGHQEGGGKVWKKHQ